MCCAAYNYITLITCIMYHIIYICMVDHMCSNLLHDYNSTWVTIADTTAVKRTMQDSNMDDAAFSLPIPSPDGTGHCSFVPTKKVYTSLLLLSISFDNSAKGFKISIPVICKAGFSLSKLLAALHMAWQASVVGPVKPSALQMNEVSFVSPVNLFEDMHADSFGISIKSGSRTLTSKLRGTSKPALCREIGSDLIKTFVPLRERAACKFGDAISAMSLTLISIPAFPLVMSNFTPLGRVASASVRSTSTVNVCS